MLDLNTDIANLNRVGASTAKKLKKLGVATVRDLLFYFPFRYDDFSKVTPIAELRAGFSANVVGQIDLLQNKRSPRRRMNITEALITDGTGANGHLPLLKVIWFNQPFIARILKVGDWVSLAGKVEDDYGGLAMMSPIYEKVNPPTPLYQGGKYKSPYPPLLKGVNAKYNPPSPPYQGGGGAIHTQGLVPNYHLTANLTHKQVRFLIKQVINLASQVADYLPDQTKRSAKLISLGQAIRKIHFPEDSLEIKKARERLAFDELFLIQLQSQLTKKSLALSRALAIKFHEPETKKFVAWLPFKLTDAQRKAAWEILRDLTNDRPMSRLLEGDVGSGKTIVAIIVMLNVALNKKQAVFMAPTEILARQHYETACRLLKNFDVKVGLVTRSQARTNADSSGLTRTKTQTDADWETGGTSKNKIKKQDIIDNSDIIIGTHALIQEEIKFKNLALAIIDEQHRFGVEQRAMLSTRTNADSSGLTPTNTNGNEVSEGLLYDELTYKIRGAIFNVKKELGLGHKEKIYQNALGQEFNKLGIKFEKEKSISIKYGNKKIGIYRPDFIVENKIILELKKLPFIGKFEKDQIWHYLKGSEYRLALLVNFGQDDVEMKRIIYDLTRLHKSAISPRQSAFSPHLLSMTATPIPRSLALALYGDLALSVIDQMPKERKKIITKVVPEEKRQAAYEFIRGQIRGGRQVFVICPLIDPSDKLGVKSVEEEYKKLDKIVFPEMAMGKLHGRLKPAEKEKIMQEFLAGKIKIIVATSVVEVGVDAPNASVMMIEGADRFGLAQLHQFRGRVGRSAHQSYCFLFTSSSRQTNLLWFINGSTEKTLKRLEALVKYDNGFELAKMDLKFRGPGEVYGTEQKGFPELKIASLFDYALMKQARDQAVKLLEFDPSLDRWPALKEKLGEWEAKVHLE